MTCIIGIETENGKIVMGGDTLGSNGWTGENFVQPKIFKHSGMIFGYCGSFRFGQLIEVALDDNQLVLPPKKDTYRWLIGTFVPKIQKLFKENEEKCGNALIGLNGELWELQGDYSILRASNGYNAVGSGEDVAKGALGMFRELGNTFSDEHISKEQIKNAMNVTGSLVVSVSKECNVLVL